MEKKAARLRVISSILMAIVLGLIAVAGGSLIFSTVISPDNIGFLEVFLIVCFALGPIMMWLTHRFFHQTKVIYIILLSLGVPALLFGILAGIFSYSTIQDIRSADIPGEQQEHAVLGGVMMLMFAALGITVAVLGLLSSASATLGLWAFKIRSRIPPELAPHSKSRQSHRSKVWPTPR